MSAEKFADLHCSEIRVEFVAEEADQNPKLRSCSGAHKAVGLGKISSITPRTLLVV